MGVFRIARAEFIKIFKKPSVYLMGVLLAAVLVLSLLFFEPVNRQSYSVNLEGTSVGQVYDKFTNDSNVSSGDIKQSKYNQSITDNLTKIEFYEVLNERTISLKKVNDEFIVLFGDLSQKVKTTDSDAIAQTHTSIKNKIKNYSEVYNNIESLSLNCDFYKHFTTLPIYTESKTYIQELINRSTNDSAVVFVNVVKSGNYIEKLNSIYSTNEDFVRSTLSYYAKSISEKQTAYYNGVINNPSTDQTIFLNYKTTLEKEVSTFLTNIKLLAESKYSLTFIDKAEYDAMIKNITDVQTTLESYDSESNSKKAPYERHKIIVNKLLTLTLSDNIVKFSENLIDFNVSADTLKELKETIEKRITELKNGLSESIETANKNAASKLQKDIDELNNLITSYKELTINTSILVNNTINLEAISVLDPNSIVNYINFNNFNVYEKTEELTKSKYYITSGTYNHNYNDVFAFNKNSGETTNAYDFVFYGMEIATLIITIFAIFMAASLMASEYDSGTIKLLAMRPFKRWKIITGKLFATMTFVLLFVLFSLGVCGVAGVCLYPIDNTLILTTFNSSVSFVLHPLVLMAINVGCILLEIFFYTVIALSISTIFRSYTTAISISCIMYILALSFNILFGGAFWYSFIPFINADLFKYFGGSFLATSSTAFNKLFTPTLLSNANFFVSLGIYGATILVFIVLTYVVFRVRDF